MNGRESTADDEVADRCSYCGRILPGGLWFARIQRGGRTLEFCRPWCVEAFLNATARENGVFENHYAMSGLMTTKA